VKAGKWFHPCFVAFKESWVRPVRQRQPCLNIESRVFEPCWSDDAIASAQATLWRALRIVAEPGGAAAFCAILSGAYRPEAGERVAGISGGDTAAVNFVSAS
jgi:hypothetical protein